MPASRMLLTRPRLALQLTWLGTYTEHIVMKDGVPILWSSWFSTTIHGGYSGPTPTITMYSLRAGTILRACRSQAAAPRRHHVHTRWRLHLHLGRGAHHCEHLGAGLHARNGVVCSPAIARSH